MDVITTRPWACAAAGTAAVALGSLAALSVTCWKEWTAFRQQLDRHHTELRADLYFLLVQLRRLEQHRASPARSGTVTPRRPRSNTAPELIELNAGHDDW